MDEHRNDPYGQKVSPYVQPSGINREWQQYPVQAQGAYPQQPYPTQSQGGYQQPKQAVNPTQDILKDVQVLTPGGFKPLNKEEREEAARIALEAGFTFDGYQVVRREFFSHKFDPTLTIKGNSIIFNNACISRLERAIYVQVLVNPAAEKLVVRPCSEGARDAIRWCIPKEDKRKSRQITCGLFTAKLYDMMGWEALYRYKLQGTTINYRGEQLYLFDLTSTEIFLPQVKDTDDPNSKPKRRPPVYPADWRDSFGLSVAEHTASINVNLDDGYGLESVVQGEKPAMEQMPMEMLDHETGEVIKV